MIRKIILTANVLAIMVLLYPVICIGYLMIKHRDAASIGIIGGGDGPTSIFYSFQFDPANIIPWVFMVALLSLNVYVIKTNNK